MDKRSVTLYEDIKHQVDLAETIHNDLSEEIIFLQREIQTLLDKCASLENQLRILRSGKE